MPSLRINLHDPDQPDNGVRRHEAVRIERDRKLVAGFPIARKTRGYCRP